MMNTGGFAQTAKTLSRFEGYLRRTDGSVAWLTYVSIITALSPSWLDPSTRLSIIILVTLVHSSIITQTSHPSLPAWCVRYSACDVSSELTLSQATVNPGQSAGAAKPVPVETQHEDMIVSLWPHSLTSAR